MQREERAGGRSSTGGSTSSLNTHSCVGHHRTEEAKSRRQHAGRTSRVIPEKGQVDACQAGHGSRLVAVDDDGVPQHIREREAVDVCQKPAGSEQHLITCLPLINHAENPL